MKSLTDEQYDDLKSYAMGRGMNLYGYQNSGGRILLNNSVRDGVGGKTLPELRKEIRLATL